MKYVLTIETANAADLLQLLGGVASSGASVIHAEPIHTAAAPPPMPMPAAPDDNGDDNGTPNTNAPAHDASGLPWDERIHSAGKALTDKGVWRKKRGVTDATIAAVENELRTRGHMPSAPVQPMQPYAPPPMPVAPVQPFNPPTQQFAPPPVPMQTFNPPPMPAPAPVQQIAQSYIQPQQHDVMDFHTFMQHFSQSLQQGKIDASYAAAIAARFGLTAITDVSGRADLIPFVVAHMRSEGRLV